MTNNEEINELLKCSICEYFKNGVCTTKEYCEYERHRAIVVMQEFAQWKDEQFEKEKQQWIEKACVAHCNNCYTRYGNCQEESYRMQCQRYVNFKKAMEEL